MDYNANETLIIDSLHPIIYPCSHTSTTHPLMVTLKLYQVFFKLHELIDFLRNPYKNSFLFLWVGRQGH